MAIVSEVTCRRCGNKYSGLRRTCPLCGAPKSSQPTRVPPTTTSATPRTRAYDQANASVKWQLVFGAVLILAVILVVVVLILSGSKKSNPVSGKPATNTSSVQSYFTSADLPTPSASPAPTPEASPTPPIESMAITFLNSTVGKDLTITDAGSLTIDLDLNVYPPQDDATVTWTSSNEKILQVDERGIVTIVGASPNQMVHATIVAECCGMQAYVTVYVPAFQAAYLTQNLFDATTYEEDNLEWDTLIYASPTPRA